MDQIDHIPDAGQAISAREKPLVLIAESAAGSCRQDLVSYLSGDYDIAEVESGREVLREAQAKAPDLILLSLSLNGQDALQICEAIRKEASTKKIPIIALSDQDRLEAKLSAFRKGADDFLAQPFALEELAARIASKLREWRPTPVLRAGSLTVDLRSMVVEVKGKPGAFTMLEIELVTYFLKHQGRIVSREELLREIWHDRPVMRRTVDTHIVSLRKKLRGSGLEISSLYGAGYVLRIRKKAAGH